MEDGKKTIMIYEKKITVVTHPNIAFTKYWGKRNKEFILPWMSSNSVTLGGNPNPGDNFNTVTTVETGPIVLSDILYLNGRFIDSNTSEYTNVAKFLEKARQRYNIPKLKITSSNNFPTGAGIASSASGFAALAYAIDKVCGLNLDYKDLSILARLGSGSATRSILGGFNTWEKGKKADGSDSCIKQIADENYWPNFRIIVCITTEEEKEKKSRAGMDLSVKTSPLFRWWVKYAKTNIIKTTNGIINRDIDQLGSAATECAKVLHAVALTTDPSIIYINDKTKEYIDLFEYMNKKLRIPVYPTLDGGPQVKGICEEQNVKEIIKCIEEKGKNISGTKIAVLKVGGGPKIIDESEIPLYLKQPYMITL